MVSEMDGIEKAKRYLERVRALTDTIETLREEVRELEQSIDGVGAMNYEGRVSSSPSPDRIPQMVIRHNEALIRLHERIMQRTDESRKVIEQIAELEKPLHVTILNRRYIWGWSLELISIKTNYSYSHIANEHRIALQEFFERFLKGESNEGERAQSGVSGTT